MVNSMIEECIGPFNVLRNDEQSKTIAVDQSGAIKRYSTSQIRPFWEHSSMLDDSITKHKIEGQHVWTDNEPDEPEFDCDDVQLDVDQQWYGEHSIIDDSSNMAKICDREIKNVGKTENMIKENSKKSEWQSTTIRDSTPYSITR